MGRIRRSRNRGCFHVSESSCFHVPLSCTSRTLAQVAARRSAGSRGPCPRLCAPSVWLIVAYWDFLPVRLTALAFATWPVNKDGAVVRVAVREYGHAGEHHWVMAKVKKAMNMTGGFRERVPGRVGGHGRPATNVFCQRAADDGQQSRPGMVVPRYRLTRVEGNLHDKGDVS